MSVKYSSFLVLNNNFCLSDSDAIVQIALWMWFAKLGSGCMAVKKRKQNAKDWIVSPHSSLCVGTSCFSEQGLVFPQCLGTTVCTELLLNCKRSNSSVFLQVLQHIVLMAFRAALNGNHLFDS